jgi:DNA replication protein DnaC
MACEQCVDGQIITERDGRRFSRECECRAVLKLEGMLRRCGLPPRYQQASFESFVTAGRDQSVWKGLGTAKNYVENFIGNEGMGLLFTGTVGVGKTHLAIAVIRELTLRYSTRCYFTDFRELLKKMQESFDKNTAVTRMDVVRPVLEAECVVIDELGAARVTDWTYEVAEEIINARYNSARATIFTTNLTNQPGGWGADRGEAGGYGQMARIRLETLGDRLGARMHSRLQEMCTTVEMNGEDYRPTAKGRT